jgi:aspartate racemase
MPRHIGIVACSAEGAALCYRTICNEAAEFLGEHAHPEVSMHTHCLAEYEVFLDRHDLEGVGKLMLSSAQKLESIGAEVLICPDNTIHQVFSYVAARSSAQWLHIAEVVAEAVRERGFHRLGLLGTRWLVESEVYPTILQAHGFEYVRPVVEDRQRVHDIIRDELVCSVQCRESIDTLAKIISQLAEQGCDAVILGCTELPLVLNDSNSPLPTLDSTRLLARAALRAALA